MTLDIARRQIGWSEEWAYQEMDRRVRSEVRFCCFCHLCLVVLSSAGTLLFPPPIPFVGLFAVILFLVCRPIVVHIERYRVTHRLGYHQPDAVERFLANHSRTRCARYCRAGEFISLANSCILKVISDAQRNPYVRRGPYKSLNSDLALQTLIQLYDGLRERVAKPLPSVEYQAEFQYAQRVLDEVKDIRKRIEELVHPLLFDGDDLEFSVVLAYLLLQLKAISLPAPYSHTPADSPTASVACS